MYGELYNLFDQYVPTYTDKSKNYYQPWYNSSIISNLHLKARFRLYIKTGSYVHYMQYQRLKSQIKQEINKSYKRYVQKIESNISIHLTNNVPLLIRKNIVYFFLNSLKKWYFRKARKYLKWISIVFWWIFPNSPEALWA